MLKDFEKPSQEQAECFTRYLFKALNMEKPDHTVNTERMAQQFNDYGRPVPADMHKFAEYNIYKQTTALTEKLFISMKKYKDDIKFVLYGNAHETFE